MERAGVANRLNTPCINIHTSRTGTPSCCASTSSTCVCPRTRLSNTAWTSPLRRRTRWRPAARRGPAPRSRSYWKTRVPSTSQSPSPSRSTPWNPSGAIPGTSPTCTPRCWGSKLVWVVGDPPLFAALDFTHPFCGNFNNLGSCTRWELSLWLIAIITLKYFLFEFYFVWLLNVAHWCKITESSLWYASVSSPTPNSCAQVWLDLYS